MKLLNSGLMKQKKEKDEFDKNKYKFTGASGGFGTEKGGFLEINKREADLIMGRNRRKENEPREGNFGKKGKKGKKGGAFGKKKNFGKRKGGKGGKGRK